MPEFCSDILHNILSRLPAKDLFRLKAVCKLWKHIIDDPFFIKSHTKYQQSCAADILIRDNYGGKLFSLSLDRLNYADEGVMIGLIPIKQLIHRGLPIVGPLPAASCNGLILIHNVDIKRSWAIWNPLVKDFHEVPPPPTQSKYAYSTSLARVGFGYDEASDNYKIVRVDKLNRYTANEYYRSMIYSLKSRCWRAIEGFPEDEYWGMRGVYLNGALHWRSRHGIVVLHLGREDYHFLAFPPPPPPPVMGSCIIGSLDALDGCLIFSYGHTDYKGLDVWVMNSNAYETDKAWTKLFSVVKRNWPAAISPNLSLVAYLKSKGQVFLHYGDSGLIWLDLENKCSKEITVSDFRHNLLSFDQFSPGSLVRLDNSKSTSGRKRKREEKEGANYAEFGRKVPVDCVSSQFII